MVKFVLPLPETTNAIYRSSNRHWYTSSKHKDWFNKAGMMVKVHWGNQKPIKGSLSVEILLYLKRDRDIDGSIKPILDLFQKLGVYENDKNIRQLTVYKIMDKKNPKAEVTINTLL